MKVRDKKEYRKKYYQDHRDQILEQIKDSRIIDKTKEYHRRYRKKYPDRIKELQRNQNYKNLYGITLEDYNKILFEQQGKCAICGKYETSIIKNRLQSLSVDHDHKTGKIRGLLCIKCNNGLGRFEDSFELLELATKYLKLWR